MRRTPLRRTGQSDTARTKERIQALLRAIAIEREGGCVFRFYPEVGACGSRPTKDGHLILQFDHLNTRARNISSGDLRLGVCVCERHHIFWKLQHPDEYIMDWLRRQ